MLILVLFFFFEHVKNNRIPKVRTVQKVTPPIMSILPILFHSFLHKWADIHIFSHSRFFPTWRIVSYRSFWGALLSYVTVHPSNHFLSFHRALSHSFITAHNTSLCERTIDIQPPSYVWALGCFQYFVIKTTLQWATWCTCIFILLKVYVQGRFLEGTLANQTVNTYVILLGMAIPLVNILYQFAFLSVTSES